MFINNPGHMAWPPCLYMVNTLQKSSSPEPVDRFQRNLACSIGDWSTTMCLFIVTFGP